MLQIINQDKLFTNHLDSFLSSAKIDFVGFNYNVIAVFGSQSSGKSTLLNLLFNTRFNVMTGHTRVQTTKGIWLSCTSTTTSSSSSSTPCLILDVEGTDGRERGEDQDFERKSSLFALAVSQVIIINLWEHVVGLYHGANLALLKTVLEVNLQLFVQPNHCKTHLFFVIRDHASPTPLDSLSKTILQDLNTIWASLNKPQGLDHFQLTDLFDISFASLAHKLLATDQFTADVQSLKLRFTDNHNDGYVFQTKPRVPADGFAQFAKDIWTQIDANVDLDLPTQQELLAQFRCDELLTTAMDLYTNSLQEFKLDVDQATLIDSLGECLDSHLATVVSMFDEKASRYHSGVFIRKHHELISRAHDLAFAIFLAQIRNLVRKQLTVFKSTLDFKLSDQDADFYAVVHSTEADVIQQFTKIAKESCMKETEWTYTDLETELKQHLSTHITSRRQTELEQLIHNTQKDIHNALPETITKILTSPPVAWDKLNTHFSALVNDLIQTFTNKSRGLVLTESETSSAVDQVYIKALTILDDCVQASTTDRVLLQVLKSGFEQKFRYDDHGVPRVWQMHDDIEHVYRVAVDVAESRFKTYVHVEMAYLQEIQSKNKQVQDLVTRLQQSAVVSGPRSESLRQRFKAEADVLYVEAKRSTVVTSAYIPRWVLVVIAVLGYNEFVSVIQNPMVLMLAVFFAACFAVVYATGMLGPVQVLVVNLAQLGIRRVGMVVRAWTRPDPSLEAFAMDQVKKVRKDQ